MKPKIKEIRRNLYEIENKKNLPKSKKEIEKNLFELEECLCKHEKYYDYDDIEYKETRDVRNLFNLSTKEDFYKPIRIISVFDKTTVISHMKVKGIKTKFYQLKNILLLSDHI